MQTTTATTGPPPTLTAAVQQRIDELTARGVTEFTLADFAGVAEAARRTDAWLADHLMVLSGTGTLSCTIRHGSRVWAVR